MKHLPCHSELHHTRVASIPHAVLPLHGTVVGQDYLPEASPGSEPSSLARQRWHTTTAPLSQHKHTAPEIMFIDSLTPVRWSCNPSQFQTHLKDTNLKCFLYNCPEVNATGPTWWLVNIETGGDGLVLSGSKATLGPILTKIYVAIWHMLQLSPEGPN